MPIPRTIERTGEGGLARQAGAAAQAALAHSFVEAQDVWTSFLLEHLVAVRRRLGDLDTALLLTVIGLVCAEGGAGRQAAGHRGQRA